MANVNDIYQVVAGCFSTDAEQASENISHWRVTAVAGAGITDQVFATDFFSVLSGVYAPWMGAAAGFYWCSVQKVLPVPRLKQVYSVHAPVSGTATDELLPTQCSGLIDYGDGTAIRSHVGRMFVGFPARNWLDTVLGYGDLNAAGEAVLQAIGNQYITPQVVGGGGNSISLQFGTLAKSSGIFTPLTTATPRIGFATQKRRGFFGKKNVLPV